MNERWERVRPGRVLLDRGQAVEDVFAWSDQDHAKSERESNTELGVSATSPRAGLGGWLAERNADARPTYVFEVHHRQLRRTARLIKFARRQRALASEPPARHGVAMTLQLGGDALHLVASSKPRSEVDGVAASIDRR